MNSISASQQHGPTQPVQAPAPERKFTHADGRGGLFSPSTQLSLQQQVTLIVNKITRTTFDVLSKQLIELIKSSAAAAAAAAENVSSGVAQPVGGDTIHHLVVAPIFTQLSRSSDGGSAELLSELCSVIFQQDCGPKSAFRRVLLDKCQDEFNEAVKPAVDPAAAANMSPEQVLELELKRKQKLLAYVRFIGELYLRGLLGSAPVLACLNQLLDNVQTRMASQQVPEAELSSLCKVISKVGKKLEEQVRSREQMNVLYESLSRLSTDETLPRKLRFEAMDTCALWRAVAPQGRSIPEPAPAQPTLDDRLSAIISDLSAAGPGSQDLKQPIKSRNVSDGAAHRTYIKEVRRILKKIVRANFQVLSNKLIALIKSSAAAAAADEAARPACEQIIQLVVAQIFVKLAESESVDDSAELLSELCYVINKQLVHGTFFDGVNKLTGEPKSIFRRVLLEKCQAEFKEVIDLASKSPELELKHKHKMLSCMRFIGEVFLRGLVGPSIMLVSLSQLLNSVQKRLASKQVPEAELNSFCMLIGKVGKKLEEQVENRERLNALYESFSCLVADENLPSKLRSEAMDTCALWRGGAPRDRSMPEPAPAQPLPATGPVSQDLKQPMKSGGASEAKSAPQFTVQPSSPLLAIGNRWSVRYDDAPYSEAHMKVMETIARLKESTAEICPPNPGEQHGFLHFVSKEAAEAVYNSLTALSFKLRRPLPTVCCTQRVCRWSMSSPLPSSQTEGQLGANVTPFNHPVTGKPLGVLLGLASLGLYLRKYWLHTFPTLQMAEDNMCIRWNIVCDDVMAAQIQTAMIGEIQKLCASLTEIRQPLHPVVAGLKWMLSAKAEKINAAPFQLACAAIELPTENEHVGIELSCVLATADVSARQAVLGAFGSWARAQKAVMAPVPGVAVTEESTKVAESANCMLVRSCDPAVPVLLVAVFEGIDVPAAKERLLALL